MPRGTRNRDMLRWHEKFVERFCQAWESEWTTAVSCRIVVRTSKFPERRPDMSEFETKSLPAQADVLAPDGSEVRILCGLSRGSMAQFTLPPRRIARAVMHKSVEEIWYFISGQGYTGGNGRR